MLILINSLINEPEEVDVRIGIRQSFLRLGIKKILLELESKMSNNEEFMLQVRNFYEDEKVDNEELKEIIPNFVELENTGK